METVFKFICIGFTVQYLVYASPPPFRCDYTHDNDAHAWFKVHELPATYNQSKQICQDEGSSLAYPETYYINKLMISSMSSSEIDMIHTDLKVFIFPDLVVDVLNYDEEFVMSRTGRFEKKLQRDYLPFICFKRDKNLSKCGADPDYLYDTRTESCYKFHHLRLSWKAARHTCKAEGGHLAVINSEDEAQVVRDIFSFNPAESIPGMDWKDSAYLGFHKKKKNMKWTTVDGKALSQSGYEKWYQGEPNNANGNEHCGSVGRNGLLFDDPCGRALPFICEKELKGETCIPLPEDTGNDETSNAENISVVNPTTNKDVLQDLNSIDPISVIHVLAE